MTTTPTARKNTTLRDIGIEDLSTRARDIACAALNLDASVRDLAAPHADEDTLPYFRVTALRDALANAWDVMTPETRESAREIARLLEAHAVNTRRWFSLSNA